MTVSAASRNITAGEIGRELPAAAADWVEYDGPELHPGTPEYDAEHGEYRAWAGLAGPENKPVPYTLTPQAEAALDAVEPEPEAEP
jgi:hypothetical protein